MNRFVRLNTKKSGTPASENVFIKGAAAITVLGSKYVILLSILAALIRYDAWNMC